MTIGSWRFPGSLVLLTLLTLTWAQEPAVTTEDIFVDHRSTVPVNRGASVDLFARHYPAQGDGLGAVVVLSSDILPADAGLGLDLGDGNDLEALARLGFDVFAADVTGYGFSPKPQMDDGCNASDATQNALLMPYPLYIPCEPSYSRLLTSLESDWAEVASFVEEVSRITGDERVTLIGWSMGAARAAGYAANDPESVERLVLISPSYARDAAAEVPSPYPSGRPLRVHRVSEVVGEWGTAMQCGMTTDMEAATEALRQKVNELDPVAAGWGYDLGSLFRSPGIVGLAGFDSGRVSSISVPTLVVTGSGDGSDGQALYEDLTVAEKIRLDVECGSRWLPWEENFGAVLEAITEFLREGTVNAAADGEIQLDRNGEFHQ